MIRVTVPRPVAEALMPRPCPHVDCEGEGDTHCWGCHGSGVLPPVLRLLVVGDAMLNWSYPPPAIVRAIEAGERIGIETECQTSVHLRPGRECIDNPNCTDGRVPVGSVRPVEVLPIIDEDQWKAAPGPPDAYYTVSPGKPYVVFDPLLRKVDLSVYGPAESLVGKFAVEVEDARREQ